MILLSIKILGLLIKSAASFFMGKGPGLVHMGGQYEVVVGTFRLRLIILTYIPTEASYLDTEAEKMVLGASFNSLRLPR